MTDRGSARREAMEQAGVELLAEAGWAAVTVRAITKRSGANPGLVHYYYGGLPGLHLAIATRAVAMAVRPAVQAVLDAEDLAAGVHELIVVGTAEAAPPGRLTAELIGGAFRDDVIRDVVREEFRAARAKIATKIADEQPRGPRNALPERPRWSWPCSTACSCTI